MNDDTVQELKQFIVTTVSHQTSDIVKRIDRVESKIDDLSASVAGAIDTINRATGT